ncbi:uncharacterized protein Hap1MRO34_020869 isoform 2-T2 [Clarias gariepinus]|uniref:uncharacterized protein LOC128542542 isoform X2 n=1 Tax=Clarias gariepinus TaxID=13013 RepID=UPI00234E23D5|nr:uncharacterized protein LOC128542542 isoform X2 [Clarias gariepinus]
METQRLLELQMLISEESSYYIKAGASFCSYQFKRTCILDSHLAALHTTFIRFQNVRYLFNSDEPLKNIMALLNGKKYVEARIASAWQLKHVWFNHMYKEIDFYGNMQEHSNLFNKLVCAEMTSDQEIPNDSVIHNEILRRFNTFSRIKALGDPADPALILGYGLTTEPLLLVEDKKNRIFQLQFLLLGKGEHMTMCFQFFSNIWLHYNNDPAKPSFQSFSLDKVKDYVVYLAGYINMSQALEYKLGITETRGGGTKCFVSGVNHPIHLDPRQSVQDVEMKDLSSYSFPIPKTKEGLRPQPWEYNRLHNLQMLIEDPFPYIKAGGPSDLCQLTNTCVLDSLLAAFHTSCMKYPNIDSLLHSNDFFAKVRSLLNKKIYIKTRNLCVEELNLGKLDLYGNVKDYFPLISKLACAEITYRKNAPKDLAIYKEIPSIPKIYDKVFVMGDPSDPTLILVHCENYINSKNTEWPLCVNVKERIFALQFLLIGKEQHMTMCFQSFENTWHLYDDDPKKPSFQPFNFKSLKDYIICLAGYVNITQLQEYKSIAETSEGSEKQLLYPGLSKEKVDPYNNFYLQQSVAEVEIEDLCSYSVSVPGTRERLGPQAFYPNCPEALAIFSNPTQPVEDIEMLSCSSSDSE